jgi:NADPH:quinone reductase-like Zn-dependent oxidoreductase
MAELAKSGLQLQSRVDEDGTLTISLVDVPTREPRPNDVVVRIEAAPINPSDLGLLFAGADADALEGAEQLTAKLPPEVLRAMKARVGQSLPVGNEGAGVVVAAGSSAQALLGETVGIAGGASYAEYRTLPASEVTAFPAGTTAEDGASWYVNPMTALGMVETLRREGHRGLVHTAAASNLGQMLVKLTAKEGIPLVNIVRRAEQAAQLRELGAQHVVDSSTPTFMRDLIEAVGATQATLAFDAIGGGTLAGQILTAMEVVASRSLQAYSRYGSAVHKQVYIYGTLDRGPTILNRSFGFGWGVSGWLLPTFLQTVGADTERTLRQRIVGELKTTFASHYTSRLSLREAISLQNVREYAKMATGSKYLITPHAR